MLSSTRIILDAWGTVREGKPEEFRLFIIYGALGKGKSAYAIKTGVQLLQHVYGYSEAEAWNRVKDFIIFHPQQFFEKVKAMDESERLPFIIWDDAGLWLSALDWYDPFLKAFSKYLNVARTMFASFILTTPMPRNVLKAARSLPDSIVVKIVDDSDKEHPWRRLAYGYRNWFSPDGKRTGVWKIFEDPYYCNYPEDFFKWYKPYRNAYQIIALRLVKEEWEKKKGQSIVLQKLKEIIDFDNPEQVIRLYGFTDNNVDVSEDDGS